MYEVMISYLCCNRNMRNDDTYTAQLYDSI